MSNHMSAQALETFSKQKEGARLRSSERQESRLEAYLVGREAARVEGLRKSATMRFERRCASVFGFFCFVYIQAMVVVYCGWYLYPAMFG